MIKIAILSLTQVCFRVHLVCTPCIALCMWPADNAEITNDILDTQQCQTIITLTNVISALSAGDSSAVH
jgi:hypothetical protein